MVHINNKFQPSKRMAIPGEITKIGTIKGNMKNMNVLGKIISIKNEPTPSRRHAIATISDDTGKIRLSLWNDQVDQVSEGDTVLVPDAFVKKDAGRFSLQTWAVKIKKIDEQN